MRSGKSGFSESPAARRVNLEHIARMHLSLADETLRRRAALGFCVWLGPQLRDIDESADLVHQPAGFGACPP